MAIQVISFDLDGTLQDRRTFDDVLWYKSFPSAYAAQYGVSFEEALEKVSSEYDKVDDNSPEWYKPSFWVQHFKLRKSYVEMVDELQKNIVIFEDVVPVLKKLKNSGKYKLIVLTHSPHEWIRFKVKVENLESYFDEIISTIDDLDTVKKDGEVYRRLCERFKVKPSELLHIGDDYVHDYEAAVKVGVNALFLDREGKKGIQSLYQVVEWVEKH